ncbi:metal ABC transporter solute-binding protein, Zn/Mn family [Alkalicoccus halolimnae]|uniref:Zinc ABC transporter substrate-binding protein n=1 Tax=Alkalicoccus halolimnae TaxID=1667239 RepID=A0A5C7FDA2_9BACI|nr:zinc ABC transporter substrate-binding protein [Alkalicoccus halolimnae]TXF85277.1 ABC transporter substrate-binding protein [Alkalicoccus halolimnae]
MKKTSLSMIVLSAVLLAACGSNEDTTNNEGNAGNNTTPDEQNNEAEAAGDQEPVVVKTTLFPLQYFAEEIGGDHVEVENIVPVGVDAHTFDPSSSQMIEIAEADLFIYNGAGFEGFTESVQEAVSGQDVDMVTASEGIELISYSHGIEDDHGDDNNHDDDHGHDDNDNHNDANDHDNNNHNDEEDHDHDDNNSNNDEHGHAEEDAHVWLDPMRAAEQAENIKNALSEVNPDEADTFEENYEEVLTQLEELDEQFTELSENMSNDTIVVSHAGYGYWEEEYGVHQLGIAGLSPSNEPSIQQLEETMAFMDENDINYVMFEQNIPENITETVREEVGAEALELHNLEVLVEEDVENEETYFSLMEQNLESLNTALR